ncbi:MAG: hypothetical protein IPI67_41520 [Myxococcales bacterium]|nr:hypothetical protein [Myxococcales bacterium]
MTVKLHEIMGAAHARSASLAAEVAGYLILATADQVAGAPRSVGFGDVGLSEEGQVKITGGSPAEDEHAEQVLREMLGLMLLEASSVTPGLLRAAHKSSGSGVEAVIREIEVALVPVNRAAARRALARLYRDVVRARDAGRLPAWSPPSAKPERPVAEPPRVSESQSPMAPSPRTEPEPHELSASVDLPSVLARQSEPPAAPVRSGAALPVAVVQWPVQSELADAEELLTRIPVFVEEPVEAMAAIPFVPDLEVPASPGAPTTQARVAAEQITVPQPRVKPKQQQAVFASQPAEGTTARTPVFGTGVAVTGAPESLGPLEISEPTPGVLTLVADDATERMPPVIELTGDFAGRPQTPPPGFARSDSSPSDAPAELQTVDPPPASRSPVSRAEAETLEGPAIEASAPLTPPPSAPAAEVSSAPLTPPPSAPAAEVSSAPLAPSPSAPAAEVSPLAAEVGWSLAVPSASPPPARALPIPENLPPRPPRHEYAPPRYAPRRSDIDELLSGFGVAGRMSDRELCSDLKTLAGVDATARPPEVVELSETPPPVAVCEVDAGAVPKAAASEGSSARVLAGAVSAALIVAGIGLGSIPTRGAESESVAAAAAVPIMEPSEPRAACTAELTVRQVPERGRPRVRTGPDGSVVSPSRIVGRDAVFEGLSCRQSAEVTVELPGRARWVRIPISAESLSPSADAPSLVRYTVAVR